MNNSSRIIEWLHSPYQTEYSEMLKQKSTEMLQNWLVRLEKDQKKFIEYIDQNDKIFDEFVQLLIKRKDKLRKIMNGFEFLTYASENIDKKSYEILCGVFNVSNNILHIKNELSVRTSYLDIRF